MKKKQFVIDGKKFKDTDSFYTEADKVLGWMGEAFGKNLNAFDDILCGGDEPFEFEEEIKLTWKNFSKSEKELEPTFLKEILRIIEKHKDHIEFKKE